MSIGEVYTITLGKYSDKYLVVAEIIGIKQLKRVQTPKTKIDAIRLPETIHICYFGQSVPKKYKRKKQSV